MNLLFRDVNATPLFTKYDQTIVLLVLSEKKKQHVTGLETSLTFVIEFETLTHF